MFALHDDYLPPTVRMNTMNTYNLVWKVKFVGKIEDENGNEKLVRIMETPSLFVLEQDL